MFLSRELPYGFKKIILEKKKKKKSKFEIYTNIWLIYNYWCHFVLFRSVKINMFCNNNQAMPYFVVPWINSLAYILVNNLLNFNRKVLFSEGLYSYIYLSMSFLQETKCHKTKF